jgi:hypothetical protein
MFNTNSAMGVFIGPEERPTEKTFLWGAGIRWSQYKAQEWLGKKIINPHMDRLGDFIERINLVAIVRNKWEKAMQNAIAAGYTTSGRDI